MQNYLGITYRISIPLFFIQDIHFVSRTSVGKNQNIFWRTTVFLSLNIMITSTPMIIMIIMEGAAERNETNFFISLHKITSSEKNSVVSPPLIKNRRSLLIFQNELFHISASPSFIHFWWLFSCFSLSVCALGTPFCFLVLLCAFMCAFLSVWSILILRFIRRSLQWAIKCIHLFNYFILVYILVFILNSP